MIEGEDTDTIGGPTRDLIIDTLPKCRGSIMK